MGLIKVQTAARLGRDYFQHWFLFSGVEAIGLQFSHCTWPELLGKNKVVYWLASEKPISTEFAWKKKNKSTMSGPDVSVFKTNKHP